ncbi:hypothetical protein [Streptomyces sp. LN699]
MSQSNSRGGDDSSTVREGRRGVREEQPGRRALGPGATTSR